MMPLTRGCVAGVVAPAVINTVWDTVAFVVSLLVSVTVTRAIARSIDANTAEASAVRKTKLGRVRTKGLQGVASA